jgi:Cu-Zn family superoxide dismutase
MLYAAVAAAVAGAIAGASAQSGVVTINVIDASGVGAAVGTITYRDTRLGLQLEPNLTNLPPGPHGFHVHENPSCSPAAGADGRPVAGMAAGGHYDPAGTKKHRGPNDATGHLGDLPVLVVGADGAATAPILARRLRANDLRGRSLIIHAGGDNFDDTPALLGGGGARIACGVIRP